jgi:8-oxo-dGTP pyrophosphatase MutT (NUDIX family)
MSTLSRTIANVSFKRQLFWLLSRVARQIYACVPIFGTIRGAVAIIRRDGGYVVIERSDGYGLSFPGGISWPWEKPEQTLRREVAEETGLQITTVADNFHFRHSNPFPTSTYVFQVTATGEVRSSWEGVVRVVTLDELKTGVMSQQQPVVDYIASQLDVTRGSWGQ